MLDLIVSEDRDLNFKMELSGISPNQLKGRLNIEIDGLDYGFPVDFKEDGMSVTIPALKNIIKRDLREGEKFKARLDVFGDTHYLNPWSDEFKVKNPVKMEAKLDDGTTGDSTEPKLKVTISESATEKARKKINEMKESVKQPSKKIVKESRFKDINDFKTKLTREDVFKWMEKTGTRTPHIQEMLYDKAAQQAQSTKPYKIMMEIQKIKKGG
jgi:hypothetical protein